jgi:two-component system, cell cycle sensor histidine kinase and response regulator CckA
VKTILVVEGELAVREMLSIALGRQGYSVIQAGDSAEALAVAVCTERPIHLVVTDVLLPRSGARALVEGLIELGYDLPVLYLSDYGELPPHLPGSPVRFLAKPFDLAQLAWVVAELLGD